MNQHGIITPDLGEKVIQVLGRHASLPATGLVAGQAVASALDEVLGTGIPVYNDIDIFLSDDAWRKAWPQDLPLPPAITADPLDWLEDIPKQEKARTLLAGRVTYFDDPTYESDDYACKLSVAQRELYSIGQTRTQGLLNYVRVDWSPHARNELEGMPDEVQSQQQMHWLTKVFDMNCTQAAVDLASGELHVSAHYERFLRSRQLQVVTGYTPVHSMLRYLKKREELKVFGNDDMHLRLMHRLVQVAQGDAALTTVRRRNVRTGHALVTYEEVQDECTRQGLDRGDYLSVTRAGQGHHNKPLSFGRKYFEQYLKHQKMLNPYFVLTRHEKKDVWLLTSKTADSKYDSYTEYQSPMVVALNFAEENLAPSKTAKARDEGYQILLDALIADGKNFHYAFKRARVNMGRAYCEGMEDENLRRRWLAVAPKHPEFFWATVAMPFLKQVELLRKMRTTFKKHGIDSPWGALAYKTSTYASLLLMHEPTWDAFVLEHIGTYDPLCKPLPLPASLGSVKIRELLSSRDLQVEGSRMRHCVGGYSSAVAEGKSRIVSLSMGESSQDCSTVEWRIEYHFKDATPGEMVLPSGVTFELRQNYGPENHQPEQALLDAETALREQLNGWVRENWEEAIALLGVEMRQAPKTRSALQALMDLDDIPF